LLRRHVLGCNDQVGFILAPGVVEHQDEFTSAWRGLAGIHKNRWGGGGIRTKGLDCVWDGVELTRGYRGRRHVCVCF
jgi:hypothetical protein